jgi:hypothetical protein
MGANFKFDEMLPTVLDGGSAATPPGAKRQLELFTYGGSTFLRMGPLNQQHAGTDRYTVELSDKMLNELASAIELLRRSA